MPRHGGERRHRRRGRNAGHAQEASRTEATVDTRTAVAVSAVPSVHDVIPAEASASAAPVDTPAPTTLPEPVTEQEEPEVADASSADEPAPTIEDSDEADSPATATTEVEVAAVAARPNRVVAHAMAEAQLAVERVLAAVAQFHARYQADGATTVLLDPTLRLAESAVEELRKNASALGEVPVADVPLLATTKAVNKARSALTVLSEKASAYDAEYNLSDALVTAIAHAQNTAMSALNHAQQQVVQAHVAATSAYSAASLSMTSVANAAEEFKSELLVELGSKKSVGSATDEVTDDAVAKAAAAKGASVVGEAAAAGGEKPQEAAAGEAAQEGDGAAGDTKAQSAASRAGRTVAVALTQVRVALQDVLVKLQQVDDTHHITETVRSSANSTVATVSMGRVETVEAAREAVAAYCATAIATAKAANEDLAKTSAHVREAGLAMAQKVTGASYSRIVKPATETLRVAQNALHALVQQAKEYDARYEMTTTVSSRIGDARDRATARITEARASVASVRTRLAQRVVKAASTATDVVVRTAAIADARYGIMSRVAALDATYDVSGKAVTYSTVAVERAKKIDADYLVVDKASAALRTAVKLDEVVLGGRVAGWSAWGYGLAMSSLTTGLHVGQDLLGKFEEARAQLADGDATASAVRSAPLEQQAS